MAEQDMEGFVGNYPDDPDYIAKQLDTGQVWERLDTGIEGSKDPKELSTDLGAPGVNEALGRNPFELTDEERKEIAARQQVGLSIEDNPDQASRNIPIAPEDVTPEMQANALGTGNQVVRGGGSTFVIPPSKQ